MLENVYVFLKSGRTVVGRANRDSLRLLVGSLRILTSEGLVIIPMQNVDMVRALGTAVSPTGEITFYDPTFEDTLRDLGKFTRGCDVVPTGEDPRPSETVEDEDSILLREHRGFCRRVPCTICDNSNPASAPPAPEPEDPQESSMPIAVVNDNRPSVQEQLQEIANNGPPEMSGDSSKYATPPLVAIVAAGGIPESVRKAEELASESKSGVDSDELAPYLNEMDRGAEAALRVQIDSLFDAGLSVNAIVEKTGLTSSEILQLLTDAGRDMSQFKHKPWLVSKHNLGNVFKNE